MEIELKQAELDSVKFRGVCGIYCFVHIESGRCYIGQATDLRKRFIEHISKTKNGSATRFSRAIREFGMDKFDFSLIEELPRCRKTLLERERFWIHFFDSASINGFNTVKNPAITNLGIEIQEASKQRMRVAKLGKKLSPEHASKIALANTGRKMSDETKAKISAANTGKVRSPEARDKVRRFRLNYVIPAETRLAMSEGAKTRNPITEETRQKLRDKNIGFKHTEETKEKIRQQKLGLKKSPETLEKLRLAGLNRKHSEATRLKMRLTALAKNKALNDNH